MLTVFSWGYEGWGNSTAELVRTTQARKLRRDMRLEPMGAG
jgi:hypothetical protein